MVDMTTADNTVWEPTKVYIAHDANSSETVKSCRI